MPKEDLLKLYELLDAYNKAYNDNSEALRIVSNNVLHLIENYGRS